MFFVVDKNLVNDVASKPSALQPYVMETTEVNKIWENEK